MSVVTDRRIPDSPVDQRLPLTQLLLVGFQHVLLMYGGAVAVPLIVGQAAGLSREEIAFLINADLLVAGIATLVQSLGIGPMGIRMPVMMGASFAAVGSMVAMAGMPGVGITGIFGATIAAGFFGMLIAPFMSRIVRFFPPLVTGTVITSIGMCLFPVAINWAGGGKGAEDFGSPALPVPLQPGALHHPPDQPLHARFLGQHLGADGHGPGLRDRRRHGHGRPRRSGRAPLVRHRHPAALRRADLRPGADPVDVPGGSDHLRRVHRHVPRPGQDHRPRDHPDRTAPRPALRRRRLVLRRFPEHLHPFLVRPEHRPGADDRAAATSRWPPPVS